MARETERIRPAWATVRAALAGWAVLALLHTPGCGPPYRPLDAQALAEAFTTAEVLCLVPHVGGGRGGMGLSTVESPSGTVVGYVAEGPVVSRSGPFRIRIIMTPSARVIRAAVLHYPGRRGDGVRSPRFVRQFAGRGPDEPIRIGKDIDAVTGATISSRVMADGVRRAVALARQRTAGAPGD